MSIQGDKFTEIADAIRAKKGTSSPIKASDFAAEIASIETGGETLGGEYNIEQIVDGDNCELVVTTADQPENKLAQMVAGSLTEITVHDLADITSIRTRAFSDYSSLTSVDLPNSVTRIESYAFFNCSKLASVTLPASMRYIGDNAFMNSGLTGTVVVPYLTKTSQSPYPNLGVSAYEGCTKITKLIINAPQISGNMTSMRFFYGCKGLTAVEFGETCETTSIGSYAFTGCSALPSITLPSTVTRLLENCFASCTSLQTINLPDGLTDIYNYVFSGCSKLNNVVLPNGVTYIGEYAFQNCTGLTNISIPDSINDIRSNPFSGCSNLIYNISDNVKYLGNSNNSYTLLCGVVDKTLTKYSIEDSCKIILGNAFAGCSKWDGNITIPDSVVKIKDYAFDGCTSLDSVTIGNNVKTEYIGEGLYYTFKNCTGLKDVVIGDGVSRLNYTFYGCTGLTNLIIGKGIRSIENYTFYKCTSFKTMTVLATTPPSLRGINGMSTLTTIYIPAGTLSAYQSATNWSSFASKFVEMEA